LPRRHPAHSSGGIKEREGSGVEKSVHSDRLVASSDAVEESTLSR